MVKLKINISIILHAFRHFTLFFNFFNHFPHFFNFSTFYPIFIFFQSFPHFSIFSTFYPIFIFFQSLPPLFNFFNIYTIFIFFQSFPPLFRFFFHFSNCHRSLTPPTRIFHQSLECPTPPGIQTKSYQHVSDTLVVPTENRFTLGPGCPFFPTNFGYAFTNLSF